MCQNDNTVISNKECKNCGMPELIVQNGRKLVKFNENDICEFCQEYLKNPNSYSIDFEKTKNAFKNMLKERKGTGKYDVALMFTGGKDSVYAAHILKYEYKLNILAITFDNGFFNDEHRKNINNVVRNMGIDHKWEVLGDTFLSELYQNRLKKYGRFCSCGYIAPFLCAPKIVESGVKMVVSSASMGQILGGFQHLNMHRPEIMPTAWNELCDIEKSNRKRGLAIALVDFVVGNYSDQTLEKVKEYYNAAKIMQESDTAFVQMPMLMNWDKKEILDKIVEYGWKTPSDAYELGHTSCAVEPVKGYLSKIQGIINLDMLENTTERRMGNISEAEYEQCFSKLGYVDEEPEELKLLLDVAKMTKEELYEIIKNKPLLSKSMPEINVDNVNAIGIEIPLEELKKLLNELYGISLLV